MLDLAKTQPDFATQYTNEDTFEASLVFNYGEWQKPENHMRFVKEEEKKADDEHSQDGYELNPESTLTIVSTAATEVDISA